MTIQFFGAAGGVTGSNMLLESEGRRVLVDCGMFQGARYCDPVNFLPFPYRPQEIDAVLVTHAHIDHTGRIPKLFKEGFKGPVISTLPTRDFAELLLLDSEHVLRSEADRHGHQVLYDERDVLKAMKAWRVVEYRRQISVGKIKVTFFDAGHILGSSFVLIEGGGKRIIVSGDLGNYPVPILKKTEKVPMADYVVVESTYGAHVHESPLLRKTMLRKTIEDTMRRGGVLIIPAFALERTQNLLYELNELIEEKRIPPVPVFLDSPLAIKLTAIYDKYLSYFNAAAKRHIRAGDAIFNFPGLHFTLSTEQSKAINSVLPPKIIIAGSGMSQGGRILHHERRYLPDPKSTILFVGYQAAGSLGRKIRDGAAQVVIFGERIPVRAHRISIGGYSAHADQPRIISWLRPIARKLREVFLVHGEADEAKALSLQIKKKLSVSSKIPQKGVVYKL